MEHKLPAGKAAIEALHQLGEALGYTVQREHLVGDSAAIDMSWTAADSNDIPLFVFEVESTASQGLANNAAKIYGSLTSELPRPLFFFHLVLKGSKDNQRIQNVQRTYHDQNYVVYRFSDEKERAALPLDILKQHRRVSRFVDPEALAAALGNPVWCCSTAKETLEASEKLLFDAAYLHDYVVLAQTDRSYLSLFAARLRYLDELRTQPTNIGTSHLSREGYIDGPGSYIPGLLEVGLRIYAGDIADDDGPLAFERWATSADLNLRMIDASFGLSRDYDWHLIGVAPFDYSFVATLLAQHPLSRDWVIRDFSCLIEKEQASIPHPRLRIPAIVWLAHLLCVTGVEELSPLSASLDIEAMYKQLQAQAQGVGGIPSNLLINPPSAMGSIDDKPDWWDSADEVPLPSRAELRLLVKEHVEDRAEKMDPVLLSLTALVSCDPYENPGQLLSAIYS